MQQIDASVRAAMLVPDSTKDNYAEQVRRAAVARGISVKEAQALQVKQWRASHEADALAGWDVLADWLEGADVDSHGRPLDPVETAKVRALESAKREPQRTVLDTSNREVREEIEKGLRSHQRAGSTEAPVVTEDGAEVPAEDVRAVAEGDKEPPKAPKRTPVTDNKK